MPCHQLAQGRNEYKSNRKDLRRVCCRGLFCQQSLLWQRCIRHKSHTKRVQATTILLSSLFGILRSRPGTGCSATAQGRD
jgi:hypothetical protein